MKTSVNILSANVRWTETVIKLFLLSCALLSVATTGFIVFILVSEGLVFFEHVSPVDFFFGTKWAPILEPQHFGVLPLVLGTFQIAVGAAVVAVPLGLGSAIFLSEYASPKARDIIKPVLEILAGIPTVVYGYFAVTTITPILGKLFPSIQVFNAASAAIVVGIMILPMIASLCDDALRTVPKAVRDAGYALGATKAEVTNQLVMPGALSGVFASFVLAISRAIGETMAVTLAAGANPSMSLNPLESIQTMTAFMVQISMGDVVSGSVEYQTIFAVGIVLFGITLTMNLIAHWVVKKFGVYKG